MIAWNPSHSCLTKEEQPDQLLLQRLSRGRTSPLCPACRKASEKVQDFFSWARREFPLPHSRQETLDKERIYILGRIEEEWGNQSQRGTARKKCCPPSFPVA